MELVAFGENNQLPNFRPLIAGKRACTGLSVFHKHNSAAFISSFFCVHCPHSLWTASSLPCGVTISWVLPPPNTVLPTPAVLPLLLLSHSHPSSARARVIIFFLQAPFKFSLFKFRISLPFVLALAIKLESSPEISLIKKKGGNIFISIPAIILRPLAGVFKG